MLPVSVGEQGVLDERGVPAVMVQASGERGPSSREAISPERLEALGRSVLSAVDALDTAPDVTQARQNGIVLQRQQLPAWAVRLLVVMLILPVLATAHRRARAGAPPAPAGRALGAVDAQLRAPVRGHSPARPPARALGPAGGGPGGPLLPWG